jgi:hypothetical protein
MAPSFVALLTRQCVDFLFAVFRGQAGLAKGLPPYMVLSLLINAMRSRCQARQNAARCALWRLAAATLLAR